MRRSTAALLVGLSATMAACGDADVESSPAEQQVRATLRTLADADRARDYKRYCALVSTATRQAFDRLGGCVTAMTYANGPEHTAAAPATIAAATVVVSGDHAMVTTPEGGSVGFVREAGDWRVELPGPVLTAPRPAAVPAPGPSVADASVKSDLRNAASELDSCATDRGTYAGCDPGSDRVEVRTATDQIYELVARTSAGNEYRLAHTPGSRFERTCTAAVATSSCTGGTW